MEDASGNRTTTTNVASPMIEYLSWNRTRDLLRFLVSHLAVSRPDDPVQFLHDLLQRAVQSRGNKEGGGEQALDESLSLFQTRHIEAVFNAMDPYDKGVVSFIEYHNGLCALGLSDYDREPHTDADGNVAREAFVREA